MNANTRRLHELGQSLWLDNLDRELLASGTLARYIADLSVTGLTSNPTIFEQAIGAGSAYDASIRDGDRPDASDEDVFLSLAIPDLRQAADLFRPVHDATGGVDGWVSLEVSPLLADDTAATLAAALRLHAAVDRRNLFIKIPGTPAGLPAIEAAILSGVPINVTLLFSREHCLAAAEACARGIERRLAAGLDPAIASVASLFVSRWDVAVKDEVTPTYRNRLGLAIAQRTYAAWCEWIDSPRWRSLEREGARPPRLLWASTGTKDPQAPDTLYADALIAPGTIDTMPAKTLLAFADHGHPGEPMRVDGGDSEAMLGAFRREGVDDEALAARLQQEGTAAFTASWKSLMARIAGKRSPCAERPARTAHPVSAS